MNDYIKFCLTEKSTAIDAIERIAAFKDNERLVFIVNKSYKILGTLSEGDIMRALLVNKNIDNVKVTSIMKQLGIRGTYNGRVSNNPDKKNYFALSLETHKREIYKDCMDTYPDQENIVFCYDEPEKFLLDYKIQENYIKNYIQKAY